MTTLIVTTDSRARDLSALLAATDWPEREQKPLPRGVHPQAGALKRHVSAFRDHPAAAYVQGALDAADDLIPLFSRALSDEPKLAGRLNAFTSAAALEAYWAGHEAGWAQSVNEVQKHVGALDIAGFLAELFDPLPAELVILPNLVYPTTHSFGVSAGDRAYAIVPPRKAVGESPPWPFGDDRDYVARLAVHDFVQAGLNDLLGRRPHLLPPEQHSGALPVEFRAEHPAWQQQVVELFCHAAQAIFLNRVDDGAGDAFTLYERRTRKLALLPGVVDEMSNYIAGRGMSAHDASLEAYLPRFAAQVDALLGPARAP
jgi:hypothetical protein